MEEIIHVTDIHLSGKNPPCRKDNLIDTQFEKLEEIVGLSTRLKMPVLHTGDLFEQPNVSYSIYSRAAEILSKCIYGFYTLVGTHDIHWYNLLSLQSTALGALLVSVPTVKHVRDFIQDYDVALDYCDWDQTIIRNGSTIFLSHRAIISKKIFKDTAWMKESTIDYWVHDDRDLRDYQLCLCGHYHKQYTFEKGGKTVINPGSITRRNSNEDELSHTPSICIVNLKDFTNELISLKSAFANEDVIDTSHLDLVKINKENISEAGRFIKLFRAKKITSSNLLKIIIRMMHSDEMEEDIKAILRESLIELFGNKVEFDDMEIPRFKLKRSNRDGS